MQIFDDTSSERIDYDLERFIKEETAMFSRLVDRKMIHETQLHDMVWASVTAMVEGMVSMEIFLLLGAIARKRLRNGWYDGPGADSDPFEYPFDLGFGSPWSCPYDALRKRR